MPHFRPRVEALDDRTLPSAVFANPDAPTAGLQRSAALTVELTDVLVSGYSAAQADSVMAKDNPPKPPPTPPRGPAVSEIVVTKQQDCASTNLH